MREHGGETGVQTHINEFRNYLSTNGLDVRVLTPFSYYKALVFPVFAVRKIIDPLSGQLSVWWYCYFHYLFLKFALAKQLRDDHPVAIYAHCPISAKAAMRARRNRAQKVIMAVHFNKSLADEWVLKGKIKTNDWVHRGIKKLECEILPAVDGLMFVSHFMCNYLKKNIPAIASVKSIVLPNFVSPPSISHSERIVSDLISIGTLEPRKNQEYLIHVISEAKKLGYQYSLTLIGDGPKRRNLRDLARDLGVENQVKFLGFQSNAAQFLPGHRAYVHSAVIENVPLVLIEALAHGLPVFAAPVGGVSKIVSDRVEGFFWPLDDAKKGARKLVKILENREAHQRAAKAAKERFLKHFDTNVVAGRLKDFLFEVSA